MIITAKKSLRRGILAALLTSLFTLHPSLCTHGQLAELVTIRNGQIYPTNVVANISSLAETAAQTQAALAAAQASQAAALMVSNELQVLRDLETARNATGYIRGFVESFSPGIEVDTNLTATIIKLDAAGLSEEGDAFWDVYTYFTEDPGTWPVVRTSGSLMRTNAWDAAEQASVILTNITVGSTEYECYRNRIVLPPETTNMFFRVFADLFGGGTNQLYFPVNNGISVNGRTPLTATITEGTNTMQWIGGVRVQ